MEEKSHLRRVNDFLKEHLLELSFAAWITTIALLWAFHPELRVTMFRVAIISMAIVLLLFVAVCSVTAIAIFVFWLMERYLRKTEMETKKEEEN